MLLSPVAAAQDEVSACAAHADGSGYLDRTTTRIDGDSVRQLIEVSTDAGETWRSVFDATYRRRVPDG